MITSAGAEVTRSLDCLLNGDKILKCSNGSYSSFVWL